MSDKTLSEQARELIHVTKRNDWPPGTLGKILPMLRALADENDRLRDEAEQLRAFRADIAELEADKARLDWLEHDLFAIAQIRQILAGLPAQERKRVLEYVLLTNKESGKCEP